MAIPIAVRTEPASSPILPPRQTGRMDASASSSGSQAAWKSWPMIVIGIAVLAIIAAVILMVWPPGGSPPPNAKTLAPPPAPERMDTNPLPNNGPQGQVDPWKTPDPQPQPDPSGKADPPDPPDIDQIDPPPDPGGLGGTFRNGGLGSTKSLAFMSLVVKHACDRLASCPNAGDPMVKTACDASTLALPKTPPPTCTAAQRCFTQIDNLPCDDVDASGMGLGMMQGIQDCIEAMTSC